MNDLDRRLKESLMAVRESYADERQDDRFEARTRFVERYRRRRRLFTAGSVALAGAALVVAGVLFTGGSFDLFADRDPSSDVAGELPEGVVSAVATGSRPVDSGIRTGGVWVANEGDSTITHVDPTVNRIVQQIPLDGPPQEVDVGEQAVWVAGFGGVTAIDYSNDEIIGFAPVGEPEDSISISVGEGYVWAVVDEARLVRVDPSSFEVEEVTTAPAPVDVAARDGSVWVLDGEEGLMRLDPVSTELLSTPGGTLRPPGDVSAGRGVVWVASEQDNTVVRFRADGTGTPGIFHVNGTYLDMAVSESVVWVLSKPNGHALLTALDTNTARQLGEPLRLDGDPVEVSSGGGAVWVVARDRGAILRIDLAAIAL